MNNEIRELNTEEVTSVAGGFYFDDYCGTGPRPWPLLNPWVFNLPVITVPFRP